MTKPQAFTWRPRQFRAFVTQQYWANRDEYHSAGQQQQLTFDQYVRANWAHLRQQYRQQRRLLQRKPSL